MIDPSLNLYHTRSGKGNILTIEFHIDYTIILAGIASCIIIVRSLFLLVYYTKSTSREYIQMIFSVGLESNNKSNLGTCRLFDAAVIREGRRWEAPRNPRRNDLVFKPSNNHTVFLRCSESS